ncbi:MAG: ABC-F family ATP-binding cassette domain-containing protein [Parachlamydiaceae bacterium]|nr:ABC-F family ATP-binding cassette domain-containing protein [Parachlamydiaceae bacterium]
MSRLLIHCTHLCKNFGSQRLFERLSLSVNAGERFALIGENGCGKTTLIKILKGLVLPDEGDVRSAKNLVISYLPQELYDFCPDQTARDYLLDTPLRELERRMAFLERSLDDPDVLTKWAELQADFEQRGGYSRIPIEKVLFPLKIDLALDSLMGNLSGGERMRIALAKVLMEKSDLLLLDEPTSHLDFDMINWLQTMLSERTTAAIIISHDRKFLNASCNRLLELSNGFVTSFGGSYDFYLQERENMIQRQLREYERQNEEKKSLKEKLHSLTFSQRAPKGPKDSNKLAYNLRGGGHQKSTQRTIENYKTKLAEIESQLLQRPQAKTVRGLNFSPNPLAEKWALEFDHVNKSYGSRPILIDFTGELLAGDRIVIRGPNGSGKTTLLDAVAGLLEIDEGKLQKHSSVKIGYLDQGVRQLPMDQTAAEYFVQHFKLSTEDVCKELHISGLAGVDIIQRPFKTLSLGQRKRMMLLSLVLSKANVLLLDEPTNHLDFQTLEALEKALLSFEGAILAVSHDQTFIEKIATKVWDLS